jgi:hypothetical protein
MKEWSFWVRQPLHLIFLLVLCGGLLLASLTPGFAVSQSWGIRIAPVVVVSVIVGVCHHLWILVFWRLELGSSSVTRFFGDSGFVIHASGFVLLILARFSSIVYLAPLNGGTLGVPLWLRLVVVGVLAALNIWGVYSVLRYFGVRRVFGLDHFDPSVRSTGLVQRGAYRYTRNVIYLLVVPGLFIPGLLWGSVASLAAAAFHFGFVWAHYYCTELPDMAVIYGRSD